MNKTLSEAVQFAGVLLNGFVGVSDYEVIVAPPFVSIPGVYEILRDSNIKIAAQNMYYEDSGAFTGEISWKMLKELEIEYVIIGHSERRHIFGETDEVINKKVLKAIENKMSPILCVGERLEEREQDLTFAVIEMQIKKGLKNVPSEGMKNVLIAYEPVWAIGTGKVATPQQAQEVHHFIRNLISDMYSKEVAEQLRILYGGSIKPENFFGLIIQPDIDGGLVGGASLKESFIELGKILSRVV
ncbi:triose-phosphate isomerase [Thermosipho ferrireducens]|uniref:Triosephosphate isomerase n=2 Tax=Thermosipho ferrireducens TaxID=2571116 RepID=A0ABX7S4S5_9BACT|nr:triose-phosphate isomerase [Thermosipho ferrireducens]